MKLALIFVAILTLTQCDKARNVKTIGNDPAAREVAAKAAAESAILLEKLGVIEKRTLGLPPIKGPSLLAQITRRKTSIDMILEETRQANRERALLEGATSELDQNLERTNRAVQQSELDISGSARIEESIPVSEFEEDEGKLREFLEGAYCLNLEAINKNEPRPSDDDYRQLLVHHMLKLPSNKEAELIRKAQAFYKLGQRLEEEKLSEAAFDAAVTGYCDMR